MITEFPYQMVVNSRDMNFSWKEIIYVYMYIGCHIGQKWGGMFVSRSVEIILKYALYLDKEVVKNVLLIFQKQEYL